MKERQVLGLTEEIYDAAVGGVPWSVVGRNLTRLLGASSGWITVSGLHSGKTDLLYRADFPDDEIAAYQAHYRHVDLWTTRTAAAALRAGAGAPARARISGHLVSDAEYLRSEYYADQGKRLGLRHAVGTVVSLGAAGLMPIGFHRADGAEPFDQADAELLNCLLPHLRRAMQVRHQLSPVPATAPPGLAALDALATPIMLLDAEMTVLLANAAAEAVVADQAALRIIGRKIGAGPPRSILTATHPKDQIAFQALVRATAAGGAPGGALRVRDGASCPVIAALVSPLPQRMSVTSSGFSGRVPGQALVLLRDRRGSSTGPSPDLLRQLFGLTATEAEVACALYGGATKNTVAGMRGLQESTIKSHVNSILSKTGVPNLRALERLFATLS